MCRSFKENTQEKVSLLYILKQCIPELFEPKNNNKLNAPPFLTRSMPRRRQQNVSNSTTSRLGMSAGLSLKTATLNTPRPPSECQSTFYTHVKVLFIEKEINLYL